jgi:hypothetical protein
MKNYVYRFFSLILISYSFLNISYSQDYKIIKSDDTQLILEFDFNNKFVVKDINIDGIKFTNIEDLNYPIQKPGDPFLPTRIYEVGIPINTNAVVSIQEINREVLNDKFVIATPDSMDQPMSKLRYNQEVYGVNSLFPLDPVCINSQAMFRYIKTASLSISPYQFNPVERTLIRNKKIVVRIEYVKDQNFSDIISPIKDRMTEELVRTSLINSSEAMTFLGKIRQNTDSFINKYWYDPNKNYTKIFLNDKGVYRITYQALVEAGLPSSGIQDMEFELFNDSLSIPIDIIDKDSNGIFNGDDYFQFVGKPAKPHDAYSGLNIYNTTNVYWFSYQADSTNYYSDRDGYTTNGFNLVTNTIETIKYEEDKLYSHLGYAPDDKRDYWYWDFVEYRTGGYSKFFQQIITDSIWYNFYLTKPLMKIKIGLHGLTNRNCGVGFGHSAQLLFNGYPSGTVKWNGQNQATFEKEFYISFTSPSPDTLYLNWENTQEIIVRADGDICDSTQGDLFMVNNVEIQYWRQLRTYPNHFYFTSPPYDYGQNIYWMYQWFRDNMKIYIPQRKEVIKNAWITNDASNSVRFVDTLYQQTDYYCVADDYFLLPDSIRIKSVNSDLRNIANGADYIVISHPDFMSSAQQLANYRSSHLKGYESPRVQVVDVMDIYDEFSYGLMNPLALQYFVKYAYDNWQGNAPSYITLMGDLSSDYRKILPNSRNNYISSVPYHSTTYGQAASDNGIVTIAGADLVPDLAVGRISCETIDEANVLVDRIINYPADIKKQWKQNVLLLSSGLSASDENQFKFNDQNMILANSLVDPEGIKTSKVFRYANKPEYIQYQGEGPDIRREIDQGSVLVNYYGHGGGFQWDLVFTDDDIRALNNGNMLPFVISVTCYTAHFDNQEIFGEIFNAEPGKGSIAFFGSSGVTFWPTTANFNQELFREIFRNKKYVIGDAILKAKANPGYGSMLALLTLLGDPALELALPYDADFAIKPSSISIDPFNPLIDDTVQVKIVIENPGRIWIGDSVKVHLYENFISDSTLIGLNKLGPFGEKDSTFFTWVPRKDGLISLIAVINGDHLVVETDHTDNIASQSFSVFSIDKPKLLKPVPNYFSINNIIDFVIVDIGHLVLQDFSYTVIIDTSRNLNSPFKITSPLLTASSGIINWSTPPLADGEYFYEVYIFSDTDTNKTDLQTFSITPTIGSGYLAENQQLKDFSTSNILYSETEKALLLNVEPLPPRPGQERLLDSLIVQHPADNTEITSFTNDGTFLYFANVSYYRDGAKSKIYKVGTGYNGTVEAQLYDSIANLEVEVKNTIFYHSDGFLYAATGDDSTLLRINIDNGDTVRIDIPSRLLPTEDGLLRNGGFYLTSDGRYVYNLSSGYGVYRNKYILRTFDPSLGWIKVGDDKVFDGISAYGFSSFYIYRGYLQTYESFISGYIRKYRITDGFFEEEYLPFLENKKVYSWSYDWTNNLLWGGLFTPAVINYDFGFYKCVGSYVEAAGKLISQNIGPARKWSTINFDLETTGSTGNYSNLLLGRNSITQIWDTLRTNLGAVTNIGDINPNQYPYVKLTVDMVDSSLGVSEPLKFKSLKVDFDYFPELNLYRDEVLFNADSLLQGFPVEMSFKVNNIGYSQADSLQLDFYHNLVDTAFFTTFINVPGDSFITVSKTISTDDLLYSAPVSPINVNVIATSPVKEYYTFNNSSNGNFNVVRDSLNPLFNITFDGREIINGDVISSEPEVVITLEDNSPLTIDSTYFTIVHTFKNIPKILTIPGPDITYEYTPYPNSHAVITWKPKLEDGRHVLEVLAKDASGNFFDSTSSRSVFNVFNNPDLLQVYNYPNPFSDNTNFTFELRGIIPPEEFKIKIFTVAGRLIRELTPSSPLQIGFNKIYWDGRDQDGDEIANGLYFYKIISKHGDEVKTVTQKLAKVK